MSGNLVKVRKKAQSQGKTGNLCSQGNLIVAPQQNAGNQTVVWWKHSHNCMVDSGQVLRSSYNLPVLYSYCNSLFIRDIHGEFGLINVHLFGILPVISSRKTRVFFCLESGNLY